jgi:hypothetical protein
MLEFSKGLGRIDCDSCSEGMELYSDSFSQFVNNTKDEGWKTTFSDGQYWHKCPDCVEDEPGQDFKNN